MSVRKLTFLALFAAISTVLVALVHFPIFPAVAFLEYDPADVPIFIATFAFGPVSGGMLTVLVSLIQAFLLGGNGWVGALMHTVATGSFVAVAGPIYRVRRTDGSMYAALVFGTLTWVIAMGILNLVITPWFMNVPIDAVISLLPWILAFNLIKAGINSIVAGIVFKLVRTPLSRLDTLKR